MNAIKKIMAWLLERSARWMVDVALILYEIWQHREEIKDVAVSATEVLARAVVTYRALA